MRYTLTPRVGLFPGKIAVFTDVWHAREHLSESPAAGPLQCDLEDFAVLLLGAAIALGRALLQRPNELVRHVSDHQLRHMSVLGCCASNASSQGTTVQAMQALLRQAPVAEDAHMAQLM